MQAEIEKDIARHVRLRAEARQWLEEHGRDEVAAIALVHAALSVLTAEAVAEFAGVSAGLRGGRVFAEGVNSF
jgi:hypothetical protein